MKRVLMILLTMIIATVAITGCSQKTEEGNFYNKKYSRDSMVTIGGNEISPKEVEDIFIDKGLGFGVIQPSSWKDINKENFDKMVGAEAQNSLSMGYIPEKILEEAKNFDYENSSEEETKAFWENAYGKLFEFVCIYRILEDDSEGTAIKSKYDKTISLGKIGENYYFLSYNEDMPTGDYLTDKDKKNIQNMITSIDDLRNNIILFTPQNLEDEGSFEGNLKKFTTTDVNGDVVTQDIFKDYDITMVNIWTTWCGFCVEEMPELSKLYKKLPENVNLITICGDAVDEPELTKNILDDSKAEFITLRGNEELEKALLNNITGFPTTIFVDSKGNIVGNPQVGAPGEKDKIIEGYMNLINESLSKIGK